MGGEGTMQTSLGSSAQRVANAGHLQKCAEQKAKNLEDTAFTLDAQGWPKPRVMTQATHNGLGCWSILSATHSVCFSGRSGMLDGADLQRGKVSSWRAALGRLLRKRWTPRRPTGCARRHGRAR